MTTTDITRYACEEWRDVPGYEGLYQVSSLGRVCSRASTTRGDVARGPETPARLLSPRPSGSGGRYRSVVLCKGGRRVARGVHVLLAAAFIGPRPPGQVVRHLDDIGTHNVLFNIAYGTPAQNAADKARNAARRALATL